MNQERLEELDEPVLLMQEHPRLVIAANRKALQLFGKEAHEVQGRRGGQVFDCVHSLTEAGCGRDINCEHCSIKEAVVDTLATATPHDDVTATLQVKRAGGLEYRTLQVSTEKVGGLACVRIKKYEKP